MKHFTVTFLPDGRSACVHAGATILEAAQLAGIILNTYCGGKGACGKCAVNLEPGGQVVLACQHRLQSDLTVTIPVSSQFFEHRILTDGIDAKSEITLDVWKKYASPAGQGPVLGVALDIGTTTVVAKLLDMQTGRTLATSSALNPQIRCGDDVVSRISYGQTGEGLAELHNAVINCVNALIEELCKQASVSSQSIYEASVVGNTTMSHIFVSLPIAQLGQAPYKAYSLDSFDLAPTQLKINMNPRGNVHTIENIAGFVGADTVGVVLATDTHSTEQITLAIDIGTNGEIVLAASGRVYAASCAAGPAFEGARITCGSRATDGAIEAVINNQTDVDIDIIGNLPAHSICGSGLVDAAAAMLDLGVIDSTGRFVDATKLKNKLAPSIISRLIEHKGLPAFVLARDSKRKPAVFITQKDIREVQLAKAAIRAGTKLVQKKLGIADADIQQVFLAGAFGNYIRRESAMRIGLLPNVPIERIHQVGNAALAGAEMALLSSEQRSNATRVARRIQYVEIAHQDDFQDTFAESMLF